jgi:aspartate/tyrosine/aromatic aminotransferase
MGCGSSTPADASKPAGQPAKAAPPAPNTAKQAQPATSNPQATQVAQTPNLDVGAVAVQGSAEGTRWGHVQQAPPDPILGVAEAFKADPAAKKVNLGIGAYRDEAGKPWVLDCVKAASSKLLDELNAGNANKEYLPVTGLQAFLDVTSQVILGKDSPLIREKKVAVCQSLSGTGALRIAAEFLAQYNPGVNVYVSDPTWGNHHAIFAKAGLKTFKYRYLNQTMGLDIDGMLQDLSAAPDGSVFVLHTVAHNPSGVDPSEEQWRQIADICHKKNAIPIFDTAYQGYASGNLDKVPR